MSEVGTETATRNHAAGATQSRELGISRASHSETSVASPILHLFTVNRVYMSYSLR